MDAGGPEPPRKPTQAAWRKYAWIIVGIVLAAVVVHGIITHPPKQPKHQAAPTDSGAPPVPGAN